MQAERDALLQSRIAETLAARLISRVSVPSAAILYAEGLFRHFDNRRQIAAYAGLAPTPPWQCGSVQHEQGVSKAGNPGCVQRLSSWPGCGCAITRARRLPAGLMSV
ncbi:transposase [Mesorhizobium sp. M1273]